MPATRILRTLLPVLCLIPIALSACSEVAKDTTQNAVVPTLTWQLVNQDTGDKEPVPNNLLPPAKVGTHYFVTVTATSPSGVMVISAQQGESWYCNNGQGVGSLSDAYFPNPEKQTQANPPNGGKVLDSLSIVVNVDLSTMPCTADGFTFTSGTYSLDVTASNFAGGDVHAFLAFQVSP